MLSLYIGITVSVFNNLHLSGALGDSKDERGLRQRADEEGASQGQLQLPDGRTLTQYHVFPSHTVSQFNHLPPLL
jgi:hypothetical protein